MDSINPSSSQNSITSSSNEAPDWRGIDTVILDMDGTILDLHYDNVVWNQLVPEAYAEQHALSLEAARQKLFEHMANIRGTIQFYSFDYWQQFTSLDLVSIHRQAQNLVAFRVGAEPFLQWLKQMGKQSIVATNADRRSLMVKNEQLNLSEAVDITVSSHDYGYPKEDARFWQQLTEQYPLDYARCIFVDDNASVLDSAQRAGIKQVFSVPTPDSQRPPLPPGDYASVDDFRTWFQIPLTNNTSTN